MSAVKRTGDVRPIKIAVGRVHQETRVEASCELVTYKIEYDGCLELLDQEMLEVALTMSLGQGPA